MPMKSVVSCTNRKNSRTFVIAQKIFQIFETLQANTSHLIDLAHTPLWAIKNPYQTPPSEIQKEIETLHASLGVVLVVPEYNGSFPGIFKYFVDHWDEKITFQHRSFCLIGLGSSIGYGSQALDHTRSVLSHRKAHIYPQYTLIRSSLIEDGTIKDQEMISRLEKQMKGFSHFIDKFDCNKEARF